MSKEETKLLSVIEAAKQLEISRIRVNQLITSGRLPARKVGRSFVIQESDLELVRDRAPGRPSKVKNDK